jgi:hypothetical protein
MLSLPRSIPPRLHPIDLSEVTEATRSSSSRRSARDGSWRTWGTVQY